MSILIMNITGDKGGFENQFCSDLSKSIYSQVKLVNVRGEHLLDNKVMEDEGHEIVIIVSHADGSGDQTILDSGFGWNLVDRPTILTQLLQNNARKFILIYCACEALSTETVLSGVTDPNCIGVIASRNPVKSTHVSILAEVVDLVYNNIKNDSGTNLLNKEIRQLIQSYSDYPDLCYFDVPRVSAE